MLQKLQGQERVKWKRTVEYVNSFTPIPKWKWHFESYGGTYTHSGVMGYPRLPISDMHLRNFLALWNFKAEKSTSRWSVHENSKSSDHSALDQRSWGCKVNWRTYDIAIDCGTNRFPWFRHAWCDDCVCTEEASQHAHETHVVTQRPLETDLHKILERKAELAVRGEKLAQPKKKRSWGRRGGHWERRNSYMADHETIRSSNLNDSSYNKPVDGQIRLKETELACMENWNREMGSGSWNSCVKGEERSRSKRCATIER